MPDWLILLLGIPACLAVALYAFASAMRAADERHEAGLRELDDRIRRVSKEA